MNQASHLNGLSPLRLRLVQLMRAVQFGRIECLLIQSGEPVFTPPPKLVREIRFGGNDSTGQNASDTNFVLKTQVMDLLDRLTDIDNGRIEQLVVKHGLPFSLTIEEQPV